MSTTEDNKREKYSIKLEQPLDFEGISSTKYVTSNELVKMFSELMSQAFADFEGCLFDPTGKEPTVVALFNRGDFGDSTVATTRAAEAKTGNSVIDYTRRRDFAKTSGEKYTLTQDGMDVILPMLSRTLFNNQGKPNMGLIVEDFCERGMVNYYMPTPPTVYTKVKGITLDSICKLVYGDNEGGEEVAYLCAIASAINPSFGAQAGVPASNYVLSISRISAKALNELYSKLGMNKSGLNIIRA